MHIRMAGDLKTPVAEDLLSCAICFQALYEREKSDREEKDNRKDDRFLEIEKEIWKELFPRHSKELENELEGGGGDEGDG